MHILRTIRPLASAGALCAWAFAAARLGAAEFHVSPSGSDANDGTPPRPFKSVERARAEVRKMIAEGLREPVTVLIGGGTYELSEPLAFGPEDSGTEAFAISYAANPGEEVVLSGGRRIRDLRRDEGGAWAATLPEVAAGRWFFRQLTVGSERATRARWPDEEGLLRIAEVADGVRRFTFNRALPAGNLAGQDAELVVYENWCVTRGLVSASGEKEVATATPMGWIGHGDYTTASPGKPAYLEHAAGFLDRPGEWFLDRKSGGLRYLPREGEDPARTEVVAPVLEQVLRIKGAKGAPVRNLRFRGLRFEHAGFALPSCGYSEIQAAHYGTTMKERVRVQPVAVECVYAEGCAFEKCRFAHLGASGVGFGAGCRRNAVVDCLLEDVGGNGVMVGWRGAGKLKGAALDADWEDPGDAPSANEVLGCRLRRCAEESFGAVGIFVAFSADTRIAGNLVHDLPYSGISIGFRWDTRPSSQARCVVERNEVHGVMGKLADGGGLYTLGFQPGTVLRGNHVHGVRRSAFAHGGAPNNGIFVDQGSKGFLFESNVVCATSGEPVRFNQVPRKWHEWKDNFLGDAEAGAAGAREVVRRAGPGGAQER
jgi:hypothetical protein